MSVRFFHASISIRQNFSFSLTGFQFGTYLHELGHILGLVHEHQLPRRDEFLTVHWGNIHPHHEDEFTKYNARAVTIYGTDYDLSSIMHYESGVRRFF